jgi:rod shape-determining protein MreC
MPRVSIKTLIGSGVVVLGIILMHYSGILAPLERLWQNSFHVMSTTVVKKTISLVSWHGWKEKEDLQREVNGLIERLQRNESSFARLDALEKENQELKNALSWRELQKENYIVGKISGKPFNLPNTFAIVNRGTKDGVKIGFPIIINEDILIGKVIETKEDTSIVRLITDNNSIFSARLSNGTEPIGKVVGRLGLSLLLDTVPSTEELLTGDIVVTSGFDPLVPEGLVIGSIDEISHDEDAFFQSATIKGSTDIKGVTIVSIILSQ